jgi:type II secretory pathway component GspD/PulD (secretin)
MLVAYERPGRQEPKPMPKPDQPTPPRTDTSNAPVTITVVGNKLFVSSDDPEVLMLVNELYRLLTQSPGEGDFKVIKLKNANAQVAAQILDEVFNGPRQTQQGGGNRQGGGGGNRQGGGGGNPFGGGGGGNPFGGGGGGNNPAANFFGPLANQNAQLPATPRQDRIRIVADPNTNMLMVRASPLDMITIRNLLDKAIDTGEVDRSNSSMPTPLRWRP